MNPDNPKQVSGTEGDRRDNIPSNAGTNPSHTATPPVLNRSSTTPVTSSTPSSLSPKVSREGSPTRSNPKLSQSNTQTATRSRKGSQELSPNRSNSTPISSLPSVPSAAAIQRALSVAGATQANPPLSPKAAAEVGKSGRIGREQGNLPTLNGKQPPRLRSPPSVNKDAFQRRGESAPATPNIVIERSTPTTTSSTDLASMVDKPSSRQTSKASKITGGATSALETVEETAQHTEPAEAGEGNNQVDDAKKGQGGVQTEKPDRSDRNERPERIDEDPMEDVLAHDSKSVTTTGTGTSSDSSDHPQSKRSASKDGTKPKASHSSKPQMVRSKRSFTQLLPSKSKVQEGSAKGMTVETETVSTIPQVALGAASGERIAPGKLDTTGSLRLKASNETIRPKKERKKVIRKAPSINAGNASSKADIFERKVATAVDQTNSSDSDETFVYESNPQEPLSARPNRYHSRTPSATSVMSVYDQHGTRMRSDGNHSIAGKKSMKFANNSFPAIDAVDSGTVRGPGQSRIVSSPAQHHHIGRFGRGSNGHASLFDSNSPFLDASKSLRTQADNVARLSSRPSSPRSSHLLRIAGNPKHISDTHVYDLEGDGADDERTPLIGTVRSNRSRNSRRPLPGTPRTGYIIYDKDRSACRRIITYSLIGTLLAILGIAIVMVFMWCSKPLVQVYVKDIRNVLASEQELMLDLHVRATNPNLIAVQVSDLDVNIFAKSKHVGNSAWWRDHGRRRRSTSPDIDLPNDVQNSYPENAPDAVQIHNGVDEGTDPIEDPENDSSTMLLGRVLEFDSPLIFEPSPVQRQSLSSIGEVRLAKPGNSTDASGAKQWERVLLHDFQLIVRGVLRYSLPISSKVRSVSIGSSVIVHPTADLLNGSMVVTQPGNRSMEDAGSNVELRPGLTDAPITLRFSR